VIAMNSNSQSIQFEESLIQEASNDNLDAFNQLVMMHQDMAFNHAHNLLGDASLAEDATQEAFIKAFQAIKSFRGGSFRGWLLRIVTNCVYDMLRRSNRHPSQPLFPEDENGDEIESAPWLADPNSSVQHIVEEKEFAHEIYKMLDELPDVYRSVIHLVDVQELGYEEAAHALDLPLGTVKSRLARARIQMQKKLEGNLDYASRLRNNHTCFAA
jgi:RNA polymerase sigma-70 factor, ECF subfamily